MIAEDRLKKIREKKKRIKMINGNYTSIIILKSRFELIRETPESPENRTFSSSFIDMTRFKTIAVNNDTPVFEK